MAAKSLADLSINEFLARLASEQPTPGGGSVAGLAGALAASLGRMACALTVGRPKFAAVEGRVRETARRLERAGQMLVRLMDEDAGAYDTLSAALKLDKASPERAGAVREAAALAAQVPLEVLACSHRVQLDLEELKGLANPNLKSDVEAGIHLAIAATHAAAANVRANLPLMDQPAAVAVREQLGEWA
jgi:methenyltetrahydrofolate cyclohydrolase